MCGRDDSPLIVAVEKIISSYRVSCSLLEEQLPCFLADGLRP